MAVEIINTGNKEYLEVLYDFDDEKLTQFTSALYAFPQQTTSKIIFLEKMYRPTNMHITKKLHGKTTSSENMFELVLECLNSDSKKIFICIGLDFNNQHEIYIDLEEPDFTHIFSKCMSTCLYQTKSGNFVFASKTVISATGVQPSIHVSSKDAYKEIIENDSFDWSSAINLAARNGILAKVASKTSNVEFIKISYDEEDDDESESDEEMEGFKGKKKKGKKKKKGRKKHKGRKKRSRSKPNPNPNPNPNPISEKANNGDYMECKLLQEDGKNHQDYEEVAVVPLKTNTYERGMVTFSHFLHFFLVTVGAGIGFPNLIVTVFELKDFQSNNTLRWMVGLSSFVLFFIVGLVLLLIGLADPKYKTKKQNQSGFKDGSVIATVGFYLILIHCSFALGMVAFKKFNQPKFKDMFESPNNPKEEGSYMDMVAFFDIMTGIKKGTG